MKYTKILTCTVWAKSDDYRIGIFKKMCRNWLSYTRYDWTWSTWFLLYLSQSILWHEKVIWRYNRNSIREKGRNLKASHGSGIISTFKILVYCTKLGWWLINCTLLFQIVTIPITLSSAQGAGHTSLFQINLGIQYTNLKKRASSRKQQKETSPNMQSMTMHWMQ